jgi:uncharacterized protein
MEIWDAHCHLIGVPGTFPENRLAYILGYADRLGIARLCIFMGLDPAQNPSPEEMRQQNDEVIRALKHFPDRALGYVYVNPHHTQASLDEINRCVRDGPMVGIKLWVAERCNAPTLDPIVARAAQLKAVVFQHTWIKATGNLPGESTPLELAELASRHPEASFICGHTGGDWELGLRSIRSSRNIAADLGGTDPVAGFVEMAVRELGPERVVYGSDAPIRSFASQLAKVLNAEISSFSKKLILSQNFKRLIGPALRAKGVRI